MNSIVKEFKKWRFWASIIYTIAIAIGEYYLIRAKIVSIMFLVPINIFIIAGIMFIYFFGTIERHKLLVGKIFYIGVFTIIIGGIIWLVGGSFLFLKSWAPFYYLNPVLKNMWLVVINIPSFGIGAIVGYLIGNKRKWYVALIGSDDDADEEALDEDDDEDDVNDQNL